jgi:hypothetical protein
VAKPSKVPNSASKFGDNRAARPGAPSDGSERPAMSSSSTSSVLGTRSGGGSGAASGASSGAGSAARGAALASGGAALASGGAALASGGAGVGPRAASAALASKRSRTACPRGKEAPFAAAACSSAIPGSSSTSGSAPPSSRAAGSTTRPTWRGPVSGEDATSAEVAAERIHGNPRKPARRPGSYGRSSARSREASDAQPTKSR